MQLQFLALGPLQVSNQGRDIPLGPPRQRAVLAVLLAERNRPVPVTRLISEVWGDRACRSAVKNLQLYVCRLRKALAVVGEPDRIRSRYPGYLLRVEPGECDADRFDLLAGAGEDLLAGGDPWAARDRLDSALSWWRGAPFEDVPDGDAVGITAMRWVERRWRAYESWVDASLRLGRHREIIDGLRAAVAEQPLNEGLRAQFMLALLLAGRRHEALAAYDQGRRELASELGIEPGTSLRLMHRQVLTGAVPEAYQPGALPVAG